MTAKKQPEQTVKKPAAATIDLATLLAPHDVVGKALGIIQTIPAGQVMEDEVLRKELNVSDDRWRSKRGSARLAGFWYKLGSTMLWGQKTTITKLAEQMKEL